MALQDDETILMEFGPVPKIMFVWFFTKTVPATLAGTFLSFFAATFIAEIFKAKQVGEILISIIAVTFALSLVYIWALGKTYVYRITNKRCNFSGGIIRYVDRSIPYDRITNVEKSKNLWERILGIESVWVQTAGMGGKQPEIKFEGLVNSGPVLAQILKMTESKGQDGT